MTSQRRINASRANGKLSGGPKTESGKRRSAQNARRHGLLTGTRSLDPEAAERFTEVRRQFTAIHQPHGEIEHTLVDRMAFHHFRNYETIALETRLINEEIFAQPEKRPEIAHKEPAVRAFLAIADLLSRDSAIEVLHRQAATSCRGYEKAHDALMARRNSSFCETNLISGTHDSAKRTYSAAEIV